MENKKKAGLSIEKITLYCFIIAAASFNVYVYVCMYLCVHKIDEGTRARMCMYVRIKKLTDEKGRGGRGKK